MSSLQPVHHVFDSAEAMLDGANLSSLLGFNVESLTLTPFTGWGLSGGKLSYVDTGRQRLVLKRMSMAYDWPMFYTNDLLCRSITLWEYGLLSRLPPQVEHGMVAASRDGDGWALLLEDLSGRFFRDNRSIPGLIEISLDGLAHLHSTFWEEPSLQHPSLGLSTPSTLLELMKASTADAYPEWSEHILHRIVRIGWEILPDLVGREAGGILETLYHDTQPLLDAISAYPVTLLHGDAFTRNMALSADGRLALLDWQLANPGLMTIELAYCLDGWRGNVDPGSEALRAYYRANLERALGTTFDDDVWHRMVMLGVCVQCLRMGAVTAYWWKEGESDYRPAWERCVTNYCGALLWFAETYL